MATVSVDTNLNAVSYSAGETITVTNGATLTIDSTPTVKPGDLVSTTGQSTILVTNSSTTTPIVLTLNNYTENIRVENLSTFKTRGAWIEVATTDGTASQTIDFSSVAGGLYEHPTLIEVETGNGTGIYEPWPVIATAGTGYTRTMATTDFYAGDTGKVVFYDATTQTATFGDDTNGTIPVNGAKVRVPNIIITSTFHATGSTRSILDFNPSGILDTEITSYLWIYNSASAGANCNVNHVGWISRFTWSTSNYPFYMDNFCNSHDPTELVSYLTVAALGNDVNITNTHCVVPYSQTPVTLTLTSSLSNVTIDNLWAYMPKNTQTYREALQITQGQGILATNLRGIGGGINIAFCSNWSRFENIRVSGGPSSVGQSMLEMGTNNKVIIHDIGLLDGGNPTAQSFRMGNNNTDLYIHDVVVDLQATGHTFINHNENATNVTYANFEVTNGTLGMSQFGVASGVVLRNLELPSSIGLKTCGGMKSELVDVSTVSYSPGAVGGAVMTVARDYTNRTQGEFMIGSFFEESSDYNNYTTTATKNVDYKFSGDGEIFITTDAMEITMTNFYPLRGISSFKNVTPDINGTNTGTIAFTFRVANANVGDWSAFQTLNGSNLSTALSSLTDYDAQLGFDFELKMVASGTDAARAVTDIQLETNIDGTVVLPVGEVDINVALAEEGATMFVIKDTDSSLLGQADVDVSGDVTVEAPYEFDGSTIAYTTRIRKPGWKHEELSGDYNQTGVSLLVPMTDYSTIADTDPGALGITVTDHGASPVTWNSKDFSITITTTNDSLTASQIAQYISYNLAQSATFNSFAGYLWPSMIIPSGSDFETVRGNLISGTGAALKGVRVVRNDGTTAVPGFTQFQADDGTYYTPTVVGVYTLQLPNIVDSSRFQIRNVTTDTELTNSTTSGGVGIDESYTSGVDYTAGDVGEYNVTYVNGTNANKYLTGQFTFPSATTTNSLPVSQETNSIYETNNVDGSLVTECSISPNGIDIYVDDADNTTTAQRLYNWYQYYLTTETGIRDSTNYISATDVTHYTFDNTVEIRNLDLSNPLNITGANIVPSSGDSTDIFDLSNGASIALNFERVEGFAYSSGSGLDAAQAAELTAIYNQGIENETNIKNNQVLILTNKYMN